MREAYYIKFLTEETLNIDTFNKNFTVEKGRVKGDLNIGNDGIYWILFFISIYYEI